MKFGLKSKLLKLITIYYKTRYKLKLGKRTFIHGPNEFNTDGSIEIGNDTVISRWSCYKPYGGYIKIGNNCSVNSFCHLSGNGGISIGDNVRIASHCVLISANHNFDRVDIPITYQGETRKQIIIEDDCWLGAGVKILAGVVVHRGSVIGAGSVVTKSVPPYSVVVGIPGKVIRLRVKDFDDIK
ncbi:MAG: hypothetical protein CVV56_06720 [Tenericutes bacterium HGW-Tenericutes-1]|jgi:acetyltransferase-like isoleucine patch superfamily enzyme|nr:MAG: hypothetical protein CVV56_06720 [Tenericutes bacterium HGW-Tenericutes-1]